MDIAVALGGGGVRGLAHIGVLRVLEREGFRIRAIAGTSMGGIIAACYAAGQSPAQIQTMAETTSTRELLHVRPGDAGMIGIDHVADMLDAVLGRRRFRDMRIPLAVTAADLNTGQEVVLTEGAVADAVLATIALPGIFPPKLIGKYRLIDGGTLDPVPVCPARDLFDGPVVAVALSPEPSRWGTTKSPSLLGKIPALEVLSRLRPGQALQVFLESTEIVMRTYTELRLQIDKPEIIVRPEVWHVGMLQETSAAAMVDIGVEAMQARLPELRQLFAPGRRIGRRLRSLFVPRRRKETDAAAA